MEREVEAPERFQAIQSYRATMAVMRQQRLFVKQLFDSGVVEDTERDELNRYASRPANLSLSVPCMLAGRLEFPGEQLRSREVQEVVQLAEELEGSRRERLRPVAGPARAAAKARALASAIPV